MRLYHATNQQGADGIKRDGRFICGVHGFAGGGIYFSQSELAAERKAKCSGRPTVIVTCDVNLGNILHADAHSVDKKRTLLQGYTAVKINGYDVYAVYDPDRITILSFRDLITGRTSLLPQQQSRNTKAHSSAGHAAYPPVPSPAAQPQRPGVFIPGPQPQRQAPAPRPGPEAGPIIDFHGLDQRREQWQQHERRLRCEREQLEVAQRWHIKNEPVLRKACLAGGAAVSLYSFIHVVSVYSALERKMLYVLNCYLLLFGVLTCLTELQLGAECAAETDGKCMTDIRGIAQKTRVWVHEWAGGLVKNRGRGFFYLLQGLLMMVVSERPDIGSLLGAYMCVLGILCIQRSCRSGEPQPQEGYTLWTA
mmetsp:Transcript_88831/g.240847  ORF Transcript_88831/g.240847 Transcript_88831/m.240847 type:complete len:365 (-) Transcript_88831:524-1618(-)